MWVSYRAVVNRMQHIRRRHISLILGALCIVGLMVTLWLSGVNAQYVGSDFLYSADLQTTVSTYDVSNNRYAGQEFELSTYSIAPVTSLGASTLMRAASSVVPAIGSSKPMVTQEYYTVQNRTGKRTQTTAGRTVTGYLFAPRGIAKGHSFVAWVPPYGVPAVMRYDGAEKIDGLLTYRYVADYSNSGRLVSMASSTPTGEGVEDSPNVTIWTEPTTGWLVKFHDSSTSYYYDLSTGKKLTPARNVVRRFTDATVQQQVDYARQLRYRLNVGLVIMPGLLLAVVSVCLFWLSMRTLRIATPSIMVLATLILAASCMVQIGWMTQNRLLECMFVGNVLFNPILSLCYSLVALSIVFLSRRWNRAALVMGGMIGAVAIMLILHFIGAIGFTVDALLFHGSVVRAGSMETDHISLFGDLVLFLFAGSIIYASRAKTMRQLQAPILGVAMVVALAVAGLLAKLLLLDQVFVLPSIASLSPSASLIALGSGVALLQVFMREYPGSQTSMRRILLPVLLKAAVVVVPIIAIGVIAQLDQNVVWNRTKSSFSREVTHSQTALADQVRVYEDGLRGARGLFAGSVFVTSDEWKQYTDTINLPNNYPNLEDMGYIAAFNASQQAAVVHLAQGQGSADFNVFPNSTQNIRTAVLYTQPNGAISRRVLGYDMSTAPGRNAAMQAATDDNETILSGETNLLQETGDPTQKGFLLFTPIYQNGAPTSTAAERRKASQGYVYGSFEASTFFKAALKGQDDGVALSVYDGFGTSSSSLLYSQGRVPATMNNILQNTQTLYVAGRPWTVQYTAESSGELSISERSPSIILIGGSALYLLVLVMTSVLMQMRRHPRVTTSHHGRSA